MFELAELGHAPGKQEYKKHIPVLCNKVTRSST